MVYELVKYEFDVEFEVRIVINSFHISGKKVCLQP